MQTRLVKVGLFTIHIRQATEIRRQFIALHAELHGIEKQSRNGTTPLAGFQKLVALFDPLGQQIAFTVQAFTG